MPNQNLLSLDAAGAWGRGQQMAANTLSLQDAQQTGQRNQQIQTLRDQAVSAPGGYSPEAHKELLMNSGFFEEAQDMDDLMTKRAKNKQEVMEKAMGVIEKTAQMTTQLGAPAWGALRGTLIQSGMADEESLPVEYDERAEQIAQTVASKVNDTFKVIQFRDGDKQRDIANIGGRVIEGGAYDPNSGKGDQATALQKNIPYLAEIMNITEAQAAEILTQSKDKSDSAIYQQLLQTAMRSTYGDSEEASKLARDGLNQVREYRTVQRTPSRTEMGGGKLPDSAKQYLKEGQETEFKNGQVWTLKGGNPVRVK